MAAEWRLIMEQIFVRDFGILPGEKDRMNTLRLRRLLDTYRAKGNVEIIFEEGEYHFYPDYAVEKTLCISNHDEDMPKRIAFDLTDFTHAAIKGQNSAFLFHTELLGFYFHHSEAVTLEGFSVDYDRPAYSEGTIVSVEGRTMQLRIDKERFPYHVVHRRIFFTGENFCYEIPYWMEVDPALDGPSEGPREGGFDTDREGVYGDWREIEPGLVEVTLDDERFCFEGYTPGHVVVLRHHPRSYPATYITDSKDITYRDVTLYHSAGMGVIAQFTENILLERVRVTNNPRGGHWFSLAADATHFVYCRGLIHIKDCLFEHQLDDAVNVHGIYARVKKVLSDRELLVELVHHQQKGVRAGDVGDCISFVNYDTIFSMGKGIIETVEMLNKDYTYVRFSEPMPKVKEKDVIENVSYVPDVLIEGCTVRNNRARGFLLTSAGNVTVRRNEFHTAGAAILVSGDAADWFESGATRHIVVEENLFDRCDYVKNWGKAVIEVNTPVRAVMPDEKLHKYLEIRENEFRSLDGELVFAKNLERLIFAGNRLSYEKDNGRHFVLEDVTEFVEKSC